MSDPREPMGEPVEEPQPVDDVVGQAHEGLAEAEAAGRSAVGDEPSAPDAPEPAADPATEHAAAESHPAASADDTPVETDAAGARATAAEPSGAESATRGSTAGSTDAAAEPSATGPATTERAAEPSAAEPAVTAGAAEPSASESVVQPGPAASVAEPSAAEPSADESVVQPGPEASVAEPDEPAFATPALNDVHAAAPAAAGAVAASDLVLEPVAPTATPTVAAPQPIFVQAPEEPRPRGNRGAAGGIGIVAAVCFAVLYLAAGLVIGLVTGDVTADGVGTWLGHEATTWGLWVPTVVFFIGFWLLGAIINRARWGAWVIFGLLVGLAAYGGHLLGQLFEAPFWNITATQGADLIAAQLFAPLAIAAFVIGRELTIWFGAWAAARGKRMTELNIEARREYERTLEAGPQLAR
ncbi:hypothetical protein [Microbacterium luticocti]|uniref:hypothetical protein n=1 Tax=Microbacterium luticocti TaxID=451764 RepID=UPI000401037B|nr:hypothetical protein [Microbacterium luticocti]